MGLKKSTEQTLFDIIGGYGPWQRRTCLFFSYTAIVNTLYSLSIVYMTPKENYWCESLSVPSNYVNITESVNLTSDGSLIASTEIIHGERCLAETSSAGIGEVPGLSNGSVPCTKWEYDSDYSTRSIVSEWDLVCGREWLVSLAKSIFQFGFVFCIITGYISDRIGRFPVVAGAATIATAASFLSAFSTSYTMFVILRFVIALGRITVTNTGYVILMEIVEPAYRNKSSMIFHYGYSVGLMLIPGIGYLVRRWSWLILAIEAFNLPIIAIFWLVPESPRWLLTQKKSERFAGTVEKAAKVNGKSVSYHGMESLLEMKEVEVSRKGILHLMKRSDGRKKLIILIFNWVMVSLMYYVVPYNVHDLAGNPYINSFIIAIMELSSKIIIHFILHRVGRKKLLLASMVSAGGMLIAIAAVPSDHAWLSTVFAMVLFFCASFSYVVLYAFTAELFPTVVRNAAFSACSTASRIGSITAPFMTDLARATHVSVPNGLNGIASIMAGLLILLLPETKDKALQDTLADQDT